MSQEDGAFGVAAEFRSVRQDEPDGALYVVEGAGPPAALLASTSILDVGGGEAFQAQGDAEMPGVGKGTALPPEAAMDHDRERMRTGGHGPAKIDELGDVCAVGQAGVRVGRSDLHEGGGH